MKERKICVETKDHLESWKWIAVDDNCNNKRKRMAQAGKDASRPLRH